MRGHSAVRIAASVKSGTAIEHAVNSVVTESVNIHNHSEVIQRVNYGFSCWQDKKETGQNAGSIALLGSRRISFGVFSEV